MSWHGETNPHFWPRDPPRPPPSEPQQQPGPSPQQPGKKIRPKTRPNHVRLPPPVEPVTEHPRPLRPILRAPITQERPDYVRMPSPQAPRAHQPELIVPPTSQDHWPMHPQEQSEAHWPLHPDQDGPPPKAHTPHTGPTTARTPPQPIQDQWPTHPQEQSEAHWPLHQNGPLPKAHKPHTGPTAERTPPPPIQDQWPMHPQEQSEAHWPLHQNGPPPKAHKPHTGPTAAPTPPPRRQRPPPPIQQPERWRPSREQSLMYPSPHKTNPCTWFIAVLCIILWVAIILAGILILIIYLTYRPRSPQFQISDASLNAAYLDMGYLLNADLTLLLNFTNPNSKMSVDLNFIVLKLRYENYLIANQYIEPFDAGKLEHKFARVEMVGSQIRLPALVTQQLVKQIQGNKITFELDGYFHARSRLGTIFRYSYWLYTHCKIITRGPPSGVVVFSKCITKR